MSSCYVCLRSDAKKPFVTETGCLCKGSVSIHASCFRKWAENTDNPLSCSVCKSSYNGTFLNRFLTAEAILFSGENEDDEEEDEYFFEEQIIHGLPVLVDQDNYIYFDTPDHESIFRHSTKMELKGERRACSRMSKKPIINRPIGNNSRKQRVFTSRKR
jgi:hypothetical protein